VNAETVNDPGRDRLVAPSTGGRRLCRAVRGHLSENHGLLAERFGRLRFGFELPSDGHGLEMRLKRWSLLGVPLPLKLAPGIVAREWQEGERFHFDVAVSLPVVGPVVHYRGWLLPETDRPAG
jgi:hypothetical protein